MKKLIKKILKESVDNGIVDVLIKMKLTSYDEIINFLNEVGYDHQEIDEIYDNYFKTISGMDLTPSNWMNYYFNPDQLDIIDNDVVPVLDVDSTYYSKDGKIVMEYHQPNNGFWFDKSIIWTPIKNIFHFDHDDMKYNLRMWLKNSMGIEKVVLNYLSGGWY